jgi:hypothetical protein
LQISGFAHETHSVFYEKIQSVIQHIQHALFQDASLIYSASCCTQPKFSYKVNIVACILQKIPRPPKQGAPNILETTVLREEKIGRMFRNKGYITMPFQLLWLWIVKWDVEIIIDEG